LALDNSPASASGQISVSSLPAEFVIGAPDAKQEKLVIEVFATSKVPQNLVVEFVDLFTGEDGNRSYLPAGSTPYSLANVLEIEPFDATHNGRGAQQRFEVVLKPKEKYQQSLFTGGVVVRLEPLDQSRGGIGAEGSILRSLTVTPFGLAASLAEGELLPAQIIRHDLTRLSRSSFIDSVLPDIPGVVNFGPVESMVTYKNDGEYPVFAGLEWQFKNGDTVIASKNFRPALLSPGQTVTKEVITEIAGQSEGSRLNLLPGFGFVANSISLSSSLGGTELPIQKYDGSFIVLQWKEPLVAIMGLYLLLRWAWRRNLSARQRQESASLVSLAIKSLIKRFRPKPAAPASQTNLPVAVQGYSSIYPGSNGRAPYQPNPIQPTGSLGDNRYPKSPDSRF
jgi:hypothetical protein